MAAKYMKTYILLISLVFIQLIGIAQTPVIFQPGSGLNDGTDEGGLNGGKDTWTYEEQYSNNYGDSPSILAGPPSNCNNTKITGFIQFDLTGLPVAVDSVFLDLYHVPVIDYCLGNCDLWFFFAPVTSAWNEMDMYFGNMPSYSAAFYDSIHFVFPDSGGWHRYNITNQYNDWKSGAQVNYGMAISSNTVGCNNANILFNTLSSDDTTGGGIYRPYLEIYETPNDVNPALKDNLSAKVYPNPAKDNLTLSYTLKTPMPVSIRVDGIDGRNWFLQAATELEEGNHTTPINIAKLAAGIYMLVVETPLGTLREKIIVE